MALYRDDDEGAMSAYRRQLAAVGDLCDHPPRFRKAPPWETSDPSEWQCGVCGATHHRRPGFAPEPKQEPRMRGG